MEFITDKQTLDDLNLLGQYKANSMINLFNHTVSRSGNALIEQMFRSPLTSAAEINERIKLFASFAAHPLIFPFSIEQTDGFEQFLSEEITLNRLSAYTNIAMLYGAHLVMHDKRYELLTENTFAALDFMKQLADYLPALRQSVGECSLSPQIDEAIAWLSQPKLNRMLYEQRASCSFLKLASVRYFLLVTIGRELRALAELVTRIDVLVSVSTVARERDFCYPEAVTEERSFIDIRQLYHPRIAGAVANDVTLQTGRNVFFLTGANMAGKSTLMKSLGIALYLAHIGFPVAAHAMRFTVHDGIFTSINVPDNINRGYSHFYAEVLRVKQIAEQVATGKHLVVIFDELFKGTNVKDAYDATVALIESFSQMGRCNFVISTHIMEAGIWLREHCPDMIFRYLPTVMEENVPRYTYRLTDGITDDRHGMKIIQNEQILEIIARSADCKS